MHHFKIKNLNEHLSTPTGKHPIQSNNKLYAQEWIAWTT